MRKRMDGITLSSRHRLRRHERVHDGLFRGFDSRAQKGRELGVSEHLQIVEAAFLGADVFVGRRKGDEDIARTVGRNAAVPAEPEARPLRDALELVREDGRLESKTSHSRPIEGPA